MDSRLRLLKPRPGVVVATIVAVVGALGLTFATPASAADPTWQRDNVTEAAPGWYSSLATDSAGVPHVAYREESNLIKYAYHDNATSTWRGQGSSAPDIVSTGISTGYLLSLALDESGAPHIAFSTSGTPYRLRYASWNGSAWVTSDVQTATHWVGLFPSLAIDSTGTPHLSYIDCTVSGDSRNCTDGGRLMYATMVGGAWTTPTSVDPTVDVNGDTSLALDSAGSPHIAYYDKSASKLKYASLGLSGWTTEDVATPAGMGLSLALHNNLPRIAYATTAGSLRYASWGGSSWDVSTLPPTTSLPTLGGMGPDLGVDANDMAHIVYAASFSGFQTIMHGSFNGTWQTEPVSVPNYADYYPSLALDSAGRPRVTYFDRVTGTTGPLVYAHLNVATVAVCVTDSTGSNVVLGTDQAWYRIGSTSYYVGPVGPSGCRESTLTGGTSVEVWAAKNGTYSHHQTGIVPTDGSTLRFDFYTTKVTLQYSKGLAFGGPNGDSAWFAKPSMELLSDGATPVRFRLDGTGGASGRLGLLWPIATGTGATFTRSLMALRLVDSTGAALNGGTARYRNGAWYFAPGSTGNEPSAPGILAYAIPGLAKTVTNEMRFNGTTQAVTQDASVNSVYQFQTRKLTLRLETCSGTPLDGGIARYGLGGGYSSWWFPGGLTGSSAPGETAAQVFPGTYSFEMQYKATADRKLSVVVPNTDTLLTWQTTTVSLSYSGAFSYGGPIGNSTWFTKPSMELLPGTYKFHFREASGPGVTVDVTFGGCSYSKSMVIAHLVDHNGVGIAGGAVDFAPGGSWLPLGTTDASGTASLLVDGTLGNIQVRMGYHQGSQIQTYAQPTHAVFTFQTAQATISLLDHNGTGLAGGAVQQGGGFWDSVGTTDGSGNVYWEVFPGSYKFRMSYHAASQELTQDIATPVIFQTGAVHSDSGTATQYAQGSWQPFVQDVELLPGYWHFTFNDGTPVTYYTIAGGVVNHIH